MSIWKGQIDRLTIEIAEALDIVDRKIERLLSIETAESIDAGPMPEGDPDSTFALYMIEDRVEEIIVQLRGGS